MTDEIAAIIRARIVEAAEIERRIPALGKPAGVYTVWPTTAYTADDLAGWDEVTKAQRATDLRVRGASAPEVTRWEEVIGWVMVLVTWPQNRRAVWAWARMKAGGRPMKVWCRSEGIAEQTGKRRADRAVSEISVSLANDGDLLRMHAQDEVFTRHPETGRDSATLGKNAYAARTPRSWIAPDGKPAPYGIDNPLDVEAISKHLAEQRRERERRRRAKLNAPAEEVV